MAEVKLIRCASHEAWLLERAKSIGSSDAAAVLGVSPFATPLSVYVAKTEPQEPEEESEIMKWGHRLEGPVADEFAEKNYPLEVEAPPKHSLFRSEAFLHATPDRLLQRQQARGTLGVLEIKATRYKAADWDDGVPLHVNVQVQHQLAVIGLEVAFVAVLIQGQEYRQYELQADKAFQSALLEKLSAFWKRVQSRDAPAPTGAADYETVRRMFKRASRKTISLPESVTPSYEVWLAAKEARLASEKMEEAEAAKLMALLGTAEEGVLPDGRRLVWKNETADYKAQPARTITKRVLRPGKPLKGGIGNGNGDSGTEEKSLGNAGGEVRSGTGQVSLDGEGDGLRVAGDQ